MSIYSRLAPLARVISDPYVEYLHVARIEGAWRIVNALWEPTDNWIALNPETAHYFTAR